MDAPYIAATATILVAIIAALSAWLAGRRKGRDDVQTAVVKDRADFQASLNSGFGLVINQLQEELALAKQERGLLRQEAQANQSEMRVEVRRLRSIALELKAHIVDLERLLQENHILFTPLKPLPWPPEMSE